MSDNRVIPHKRFPLRPPIGMTLLGWLFFERIGVHGWLWGVLGTLCVLVWLTWGVHALQRQEVDIFPPVKP